MYIIPANKVTVRHHPIASGEAWELGAAVYLDADENLRECGADPSLILGFALAPVSSGDLVGQMAGLGLQCPVALAEVAAKFWGDATSTPAKANINHKYGLVSSSDVWKVDFTDVANERVYIFDVDTDRSRVLFGVLAAYQQIIVASS